MYRKFAPILLAVLVLSALLSACAGEVKTVEVIKTVEVVKTVEVIKTVEVPGASMPVAPAGYGETLKKVVERGTLICGVNSAVPGFGYVDANGAFSGFDVDYCRALAAAIFGDPSKIEFRPVTASERFTALQSGEIDILSRNTTMTVVRETELSGNFAGITFYDGQGMMVTKESGITTLAELDGGTICVQTGTTTELNLADVMAANNLNYTPLPFENADGTFAAYAEERCDAVTTDISGLVARRSILPDPQAHQILDLVLSKEPLGPMVRHGDDQWFDIARWTIYAMIFGEEFNLTSASIDDAMGTNAPEIKRFLGLEGDLGVKLGLDNKWAYNIIKLVGNYEEVYNRNLGPDTPNYIPRSLNSLYTEGGLLYSPPFR